MKITLPDNKSTYLPGGKTYEQRKVIVEGICNKYDDYFTKHFDSRKTETILGMLATYLSRAKEFKQNNDHPVLGSDHTKRLYVYDDRTMLFSAMNDGLKWQLGLEEDMDDTPEC